MLRFIEQPQGESINKLHKWIEHLVCEVWCEAEVQISVDVKLDKEFKALYLKYSGLKSDVDKIYLACSRLSKVSRNKIKDAFITNNQIEKLCNGDLFPIDLEKLPSIVEKKMKPFFENLYKDLLDKKLSPISKMEYYREIEKINKFRNCPCCGYMPFEGIFSKNREDLDHFFPKSHFPFASINFNNLSPLCGKCNSDNKKDENPVWNKIDKSFRRVFYPYQNQKQSIDLETKLSNDFIDIIQEILVNSTDMQITPDKLEISMSGKDQELIDTWDSLYNIKNRYFDRSQGFTKSVLRSLHKKKTRLGDYTKAINELLEEIKDELYIHEHFLQIPFLNALKPVMVGI